jgi:hypothetical protein
VEEARIGLKRGLIDWKAGGRDPATKRQRPSVYRLTYAPMAGAEPSDKWRTYQASKAGVQKSRSGGQNEPKAPLDDFSNNSSTVSMSDNTGNATSGDRGAKVALGPGCKSRAVKSQRLVESVLQKESQSVFPDSTVVTPVSAVAADPMSVDPVSVGQPDSASADPTPPATPVRPATPSLRMPESTLRQQQIENEEKAARHRRAAQSEDQRKV